jgi:demethylmenaquinone methyltransferase / 2-methoxy-6-polyprenyl-1,4-benzoquinol methylase
MDKQPSAVSGMFDEVARGYDRTNAIMSLGNDALWRIVTVRAIGAKPGERVLDIAAGTGTSSAAIARTGAEVVALDFSAGMIAEGRRKHPDLEFVEADAERLPFDDATFDAVTISFGLRNVANPQTALAEMYRVLKPGGRVVICEFSHPPTPLMRTGYAVYTRFVMPVVARVVSTDPAAYDYLAESIEAWPDQHVLTQWMRGVGFTRVAFRNLTGGVVALHRGHKPADAAILARTAKRTAPRRRPAAKPAATPAAATPVATPAEDPS